MPAQIIPVDDPADPRLAPYRDIRERDLVGRQGRFIAEGKVVLNVLLRQSPFETESLLLLENRLAGVDELIEAAPDGVPAYVCPAAVLDAVAGFHVHRGILALGRRSAARELDAALEALPANALVIVLAGLANHDNIGAIFRNAAAFEADLVVLDETAGDPLYRKAIRVSVGAALKVPFVRAGAVATITERLAAHDFDCLALSPSGGTSVGAYRPGRRRALFFGSEGPGLPEPVMRSMRTIRIPMSERFDSLNVAAASAIALHRLWHGADAAGSAD
ncbi:RNA methyltransferase [Nitratireductor sp. CAU 1489]|uniref:RNA methyltransferase n=1 Tax=Nitratireductor arenosus TaxID=2682096 RepID=A0A844QC28_9HYPH|nr:RNA methyltransferase [Nitratireductor arenosus]MVA95703.1 RNA methyltransferase [Nitratireductor arenosus]